MKTRKTLKKKRTLKKYNKTQFRRFNKYNNLTRTMKGGVPPDEDDEQSWFNKKAQERLINAREEAKSILEQRKLINVKTKLAVFKDEIDWLLFKIDQDESIAVKTLYESKEYIINLLEKILEIANMSENYTELVTSLKKDTTFDDISFDDILGLLTDYKSKSIDELHAEIRWLISKVEEEPSIAVNQLKTSKEKVIEWLKQNISIGWPIGYNSSKLATLIELYKGESSEGESSEDELSFLSRVKNLIASLWPPSQRIGSRTRPEELPHFKHKYYEGDVEARPSLTSADMEKLNAVKFSYPYPFPNGRPPDWQYGGKSKRTVKRNVKSKKRRR